MKATRFEPDATIRCGNARKRGRLGGCTRAGIGAAHRASVRWIVELQSRPNQPTRSSSSVATESRRAIVVSVNPNGSIRCGGSLSKLVWQRR